MVRRYKRVKRNKKKIFIICTVLALVLAITIGIFWWKSHSDRPTGKYQKTSTGHDVNLDPPTAEEKKEAEENKQKLGEEPQKEETHKPSTELISAKPFITFAGQEAQNVEVAGYVTGIFEDDGVCTATFTKGTQKLTGTSTGFKDSSHTTCTPITLPRSQFTADGSWNVTLSYSSKTSSGASETKNVTIQ